jgi:SAM-dependent methyltransferase
MDTSNLGASYSSIISPEDYNKLMTKQHLYIVQSDIFIAHTIAELVENGAKEVVELGCGPARLLERIAKLNIPANITGVDIDATFLEYAANIIKPYNNIRLIESKASEYYHPVKVDVFYSQGFHHHIHIGTERKNYLSQIYNQLNHGGLYIVGDEYIPNYQTLEEREILIVIWYCHVIAHAIKHNHNYLAREEAKTLLDDIQEGRTGTNVKNEAQIDLVLSYATKIDSYAKSNDFIKAKTLAKVFLLELEKISNIEYNNDLSMDASRGDYKICDSLFKQEVEAVGLKVISQHNFGHH